MDKYKFELIFIFFSLQKCLYNHNIYAVNKLFYKEFTYKIDVYIKH